MNLFHLFLKKILYRFKKIIKIEALQAYAKRIQESQKKIEFWVFFHELTDLFKI